MRMVLPTLAPLVTGDVEAEAVAALEVTAEAVVFKEAETLEEMLEPEEDEARELALEEMEEEEDEANF